MADMSKVKNTLFIAIFVSLAAQINFHLFHGGFIIALSVLVMAIFMYLFDNLTPTYVAFCSGVFSPLFRLLFLMITGVPFHIAGQAALPDMVFFFSFGIIYPVVYKFIIKEPRTLINYPTALFICDALSNICELISRSLILDVNLVTSRAIAILLVIAFVRTTVIQLILIGVDAYTTVVLKRENKEEYKRLLGLAALIEGELQIMNKSAMEIDKVMKKAFDLYSELNKIPETKRMGQDALSISQHAHEIRGDFQGIIGTLSTGFVDQYDDPPLTMREIISIEKTLVQNLATSKGKVVNITVKIRINFLVEGYFKMLSILHNLLLNSVEACDKSYNHIEVTSFAMDDFYYIAISDNGKGMTENEIKSIFLPGYSTKFNEDTGKIQRGIGLSVVKEYVENEFDGELSVESEKGVGTTFTVKLPRWEFSEVEKDEVLHS